MTELIEEIEKLEVLNLPNCKKKAVWLTDVIDLIKDYENNRKF